MQTRTLSIPQNFPKNTLTITLEEVIDDNIAGKGQEYFEGKLIHFGSEEFKSWDNVVSFFVKKHKLKH